MTVLAFAQARDLFGFGSREVDCDPAETPRALLNRLNPDADLSLLRVALDCEFADMDQALGTATELAIIPPVSGG